MRLLIHQLINKPHTLGQ